MLIHTFDVHCICSIPENFIRGRMCVYVCVCVCVCVWGGGGSSSYNLNIYFIFSPSLLKKEFICFLGGVCTGIPKKPQYTSNSGQS